MDANFSPISELYTEHNGITMMLEILDRVTDKLWYGENVKKNDLLKMMDFLSVFADKCHHGKEESILIPEMKSNKRSDLNLINQILGEHKTGRDLIQGMKDALNGYKKGCPDVYYFITNTKMYVEMLTKHIRRENAVLFPQAKEILDGEQQNKITRKFATLEKNIIGKGKHEEYHTLLRTLMKKYT